MRIRGGGSGGPISLSVHSDGNRTQAWGDNAYATLTDEEAETLARELFALSGRP